MRCQRRYLRWAPASSAAPTGCLMPRVHKRRRIVVEELEDGDRCPPAAAAPAADAGSAGSSAPPRRLADGAEPAAAAASGGGSDDSAAVALVDWVFRDVDSYAIARTGRAELEAALDTKLSSLTYGEISVSPFVQLLRTLPRPATPPHFVDIGSGTGKAVLAAALAHTLASAVGVELVPQLHKTAVRAERAMRELLLEPSAGAGATTAAERLPPELVDSSALAAARDRLQALGDTGLRLRCGDSFKAGGGRGGPPEWVRQLCPLPPLEPVGLSWVYAPCACFDSQMVSDKLSHTTATTTVIVAPHCMWCPVCV
jgi:hypothetical protein